MSEQDAPKATQPELTPADQPAPNANAVADQPAPLEGSAAWTLVHKLKTEGVSREDAITKLKEQLSLDDESAKVMVNAVMGALPSELPSAQLTGGTNALAPGVFTLSDIGLTGPSHIVGMYWMGFGVAILVALMLGTMMTAADLVQLPDLVGEYAWRIGGFVAFVCLVWGAWKLSQSLSIRRKQ